MSELEQIKEDLLANMLGEIVHVCIPVGHRCFITGQMVRSGAQPSKTHPHYGMTYYDVASPGARIRFCAAHIHGFSEKNTTIHLK